MSKKDGSDQPKAVNPKKSSGKKPRGPGRKFKPNDPITGFRDERINRTGANAKIMIVRDILNKIFEEKFKLRDSNGKDTGKEFTQLETVLTDWVASRDYQKQRAAIEYYAGKVPDELHINNNEIEEFIKANLDLFTDGQIERLRAGESGLVIISEIMREYRDAQKAES